MAPTGTDGARENTRQLNEEFIERAFDGRYRDVERLLGARVDLEAKERNGYTALSEASIAGHTVVVGQLLRALADPNTRAQDGRTPLHRAALHSWQPVVRLLLDGGADPSIADAAGKTPVELAKHRKVREMIDGQSAEQTKALLEEWKKKLVELPSFPSEGQDEEEPRKEADVGESKARFAFSPPARGSEKRTEDVKMKEDEAKRKHEAAKQNALEEEKKKEDLRASKFQEAMAEIQREYGVDEAVAAGTLPDPYASKARLRVAAAGEGRLTGVYKCRYADTGRVEFEKVDDSACLITWSEWEGEWRMLCAEYKMASTLYRHTKKPNVRADTCHGVPEDGWKVWFGKAPAASVQHLHPGFTEAAATDVETADGDVTALAVDPSASGDQPSDTRESFAVGAPDHEEQRRDFLELRPSLQIVSTDTGAGDRSADAAGAAGSKRLIGLGGQRIVETADGLFDADEVAEEEGGRREAGAGGSSAIQEMSLEECAAAWLDELDEGYEVPPSWAAIQTAKATAQELFREENVGDALRETTAALKAAGNLRLRIARGPRLAAMARDAGEGDDSEHGGDEGVDTKEPLPKSEDVGQLIGILHSNRSLLLTNQIQAEDAKVLQYGPEAAWSLVAADADAALKADAGNYKASFRRAQARFELGDFEAALADATSVVEHYSRSQAMPNPEAAALRDKILAAVKKERSKWAEQGSSRWNRGVTASTPLIAEVSTSNQDRSSALSMPTPAWEVKPRRSPGATTAAAASRGPPAPLTGADVEKALLSTLKKDAVARMAYAKEHLTAEAIRRFYRRTPLGPDLLAAVVAALAESAAVDAHGAASSFAALASTPSALTHAAMFDAAEQAALQQLLARLGPQATAAWKPAAAVESVDAKEQAALQEMMERLGPEAAAALEPALEVEPTGASDGGEAPAPPSAEASAARGSKNRRCRVS